VNPEPELVRRSLGEGGTANLLDSYLAHMRALNRNRRTVHAHEARARRFFDWAEARGVRHPEQVAAAVLTDYQRHLSEYINADGRPNSAAVQNQHLAVVAGFFAWAAKAGHVAHNPAAGLEYAREPDRLPRSVLSLTDMRKLLRQPDTSTVLGFRDRTIMEVLYSTGIRRAELLALDIEDANLDAGFLMIREGKGGRDRVVPIGKVACRYVESYLQGIRPELLKQGRDRTTGALFLSARGRRLSRNALNDMVPRYARKAGLGVAVSPHTFRHTCATHMVRNNAGLRHVQEMLGHKKLTTTQEYVRLTVTDLKEAHTRFHPRERDR